MPIDAVRCQDQGKGGAAMAGRWPKMSNEPLAREREPIDRGSRRRRSSIAAGTTVDADENRLTLSRHESTGIGKHRWGDLYP
jgi:hypothetical protein